MSTKSVTTTLGYDDTGFFIGEGDCRIDFSQDQHNVLLFASWHRGHLANAFANYCSMTFASGSIPSCFRQDLSADEIEEIKTDLQLFKENFAEAFFNLMLAIDF
jgi:hypothetical protein